jgi:predicted metalloprotease with PDZ domain
VNFSHQPGIQVSAPWKQIKMTSTESEYLMEHTPDDWAGYVAFGRFDIESFQINNSTIQVALINGVNNYNKTNTIKWIKKMTQAVASIGGDFPINETQVLVIFQKSSRGPVPWGQVNRAGIPGVLFIVNPDSPYDELVDDWTAAHEFSHLLIPYTPDDRWFSEGFASYYQNIARARTGLIDERLDWEKLIAGFERGFKAAQKPGAPRLKSANMRSLMQMYWGGAVIALKADIELQRETSGKYNLSKALAGLNDCCLHTRQEWNAKQTFQRLDKITNTTVFTELYNTDVMQGKYPDYKLLLKELGISESYYGGIKLDSSIEKVNLRNKIING